MNIQESFLAPLHFAVFRVMIVGSKLVYFLSRCLCPLYLLQEEQWLGLMHV